jgi:non-ribosomal peptide synthetase component F
VQTSFPHESVFEIAQRAPERAALRSISSVLSFGQLDGAAQRLGGKLRALGAGPGVRVGLCLRRSPELLVAMLAAWKLGAAVVLLDPDWPRARLMDAIVRCGVGIGIGAHISGAIPAADVSLGDNDDVAPNPAAPAAVHPQSLALIASACDLSGPPRFVEVTFDALRKRISRVISAYGASIDDQFSWLSAPWSAFTVLETLPALSVGACINLADPSIVAAPARLRDWILSNGITICTVFEPLAQLLTHLPWRCGGDLRVLALSHSGNPPTLAEPLPFMVAREYGGTEFATSLIDLTGEGVRGDNFGLGRAVRFARIHVLDDKFAPVAVGAVGHLFIESDLLAQGYVADPAATAAHFVPSPATPGSRMFATGDRVCQRPDGALELHAQSGRRTTVMGHQIDLEALERLVCSHPAVARAEVSATKDARGAVRLSVTAVGDEPSLTSEALGAFLAGWAPQYLSPRSISVLRRDRTPRSTPKPKRRASAPAAQPQDAALEIMLGVWRKALGLDSVGADESFLDIGGSSLVAGVILDGIEEKFGARLTFGDFFREPTPRALSEIALNYGAPATTINQIGA